ncbi:integrase, catalytic region, zinc finger, CCHC-type containing protein, partial [Tanacetum coccineum]
MSTSNTHQQSLADAGSKTRPLMLERCSYILWASHFRRYLNRKRENIKWLNKEIDEGLYEFRTFTPSDTEAPRMQKQEDLRGDDLKHYEAEIKAMNLILISIPNDIYNSVDACKTAKAMWQRVERLMRETVQNKVDRETYFNNECDQFVAEPGEALVNQAVVQGDRVNIQSKNSRNDGRNIRRSYVQEEIIEGNNVQNDARNIQRTLQTTSSGTATNVQCYNCSEKGHYARNCPKPRVWDSKYFMEQMFLAKQDKARVILIDEQNGFLFADASRMEEIEELSSHICLMARIQPINFDSDAGPSYDSVFLSE